MASVVGVATWVIALQTDRNYVMMPNESITSSASADRPSWKLALAHPGRIIALSTLVMILGAALVAPARAALVAIPLSFLMAAYVAGFLLDRLTGELVPGAGPSWIVSVTVRTGVGVACLALVAAGASLLGVLWLWALVSVVLLGFGIWKLGRSGVPEWVRPAGWTAAEVAAGLFIGVLWLLAWLWATTPSAFFDELSYHFVIPDRALATWKVEAFPWLVWTMMPATADLLLAWGMVFADDLGARGAHFAFWILASLASWGLVEVISGRRDRALTGPVVMAALASAPTLWFLATLAFTEAVLAAGFLVAVLILAMPGDERRPWVALGVVLGFVAAAKHSGLMWVLAGLAAAMVLRWPAGTVVKVAIVAGACVAPWWVRALVTTGNPLYPMAYEWLGGDPWSPESQAKVIGDLPYPNGTLGLMGVLRLPLDLVLHPERFGSASEAGVLAVAATCALLLLPVLTRVAGVEEGGRRLGDAAAVATAIGGIVWTYTSPTTRFFAPALMLGLTLSAWAILRLPARRQVVAIALLLVAAVFGTSRFLTQHMQVFGSLRVALGMERPEDYRLRQIDYYAAARFVRDQVPPAAKLLFIGETRSYHFARSAIAPSAFDRHPLEGWVKESASPEEVTQRLAREGITHVILNIREFRRLHEHYATLHFVGHDAAVHQQRLKEFPRLLRPLFNQNGVYVLEVPEPRVTTSGRAGI